MNSEICYLEHRRDTVVEQLREGNELFILNVLGGGCNDCVKIDDYSGDHGVMHYANEAAQNLIRKKDINFALKLVQLGNSEKYIGAYETKELAEDTYCWHKLGMPFDKALGLFDDLRTLELYNVLGERFVPMYENVKTVMDRMNVELDR